MKSISPLGWLNDLWTPKPDQPDSIGRTHSRRESHVRKTSKSNRAALEALEERLLLSADIDLVVNDAVGPDSAIVGETVAVSWTVKNEGTVPATNSWYDYLYLSGDATFDGSDRYMSSQRVESPLGGNASHSFSFNVPIPQVAPGNHFLLFVADANQDQPETNETNNVRALPITVHAPDLVVSAASAPAGATVGESVAVSWTVRNDGAFPVVANVTEAWYDAVFVSNDATYGPGDTYVGTALHDTHLALAPGESYSVNQNVILPSSVAPGGKFLLFVADSSQQRGETDENNNVQSVPITLAAPNLQVTAASAPASALSGETVAVSFTAKNIGDVPALGDWYDHVYASDDTTWDPNDQFVAQFFVGTQTPLAAGASYSFNQNVVLQNVAPGSRYLLFVADRYQFQGETDETDNVRAVPIELTAPNLVVQAAHAPSEALVGQTVTIDYTVANTASVTALADWFDYVFLSDDPVRDSSDQLVRSESIAAQTPLLGAASYTLTRQLTVPATAHAGSRYLLFVTDANGVQGETNEGDNTLALPIMVQAPDLVVTDATFPSTIVLGDSFSISFTVTNQGSVPALADWLDYVRLSDDEVLDESDDVVFSYFNASNTPLAAGTSYTVTSNVTINSSHSGNQYFLIQADGTKWQIETNESNNVRSVPVTVRAADLVITDTDSPLSAAAGDQMTISWTVANQGDAAATRNWQDEVWLSADGSFDGGEGDDLFVVGWNASGGLPEGAEYTAVRSIPVPQSAGDRFLIFRTNPYPYYSRQQESDSANNLRMVPITIRPQDVDLVVTDATAPPTANLGDTIDVSFTVQNQGAVAATVEWHDYIYLSSDTSFSFNDQFLFHYRAEVNTPLDPGESYSPTVQVTIPGSAPAGIQYLLFISDRTNFQTETNESNNARAVPIQLPGPDLIVTDATASAFANLGDPVHISWTVSNADSVAATASWSDGIYISDDEMLDPSDTYWTSEFGVAPIPLETGQSYTVDRDFSIPATGVGDRFILFVADVNHQQGETNEANNVRAVPIRLGYLDLAVTAATAPASASLRQAIDVTWTVTNQGDLSALDDWQDGVYLSSDPSFSFNDILLASEPIVSQTPLPAGGSYAIARSVTLPNGIAGPQYLLIRADRTDSQIESDKQNNIFALPITLGAPDLAVVSATAPDSAALREPIQVSWTVKNQGELVAAGDWSDRIYVSDDQVLDSGDALVADEPIVSQTPLGPDGSYTISRAVTIPNTATGQRYLLFVADGSGEQGESNEGNNIRSSPILLGAPDMRATAFRAPPSAALRETVELSWVVQNDGSVLASADWSDAIYLSDNETLDASDTLVASELIDAETPLAAGASYGVTRTVTIPNSATGNRFLIVAVDSSSAQGETSDANNSLAVPIVIGAPDLAVTAATLPGSFSPFETIQVAWTIKNQGDVVAGGDWHDLIYLSADAVFNFGDTLLASQPIASQTPLEHGTTYEIQRALAMPDVAPGNYYLLIVTNGQHEQGETDSGNNTHAAAVQVTGADLVVSNASGPSSTVLGQTIEVSWTVTNQGVGLAATDWLDSIFVSDDALLDDSDTFFASYSVAAETPLASGASYSQSHTLQLPNTAAGDRYLLFVADRGNAIVPDGQGHVQPEMDETNNLRAVPIELRAPDLIVSDIQGPVEVFSGQRVDVSWRIRNEGNASAGPWIDRVFLSRDAIASDDDDRMADFSFAGTLEPNQSVHRTQTITVPIELSGTRYVIVQTDAVGDAVFEGMGEANNAGVAVAPTQVFLSPIPNLVPQGVSVGRASVERGEQFLVEWIVRNTGTGATDVPQWRDQVYLSIDNELDETDVFIGSAFNPAYLAAGEGYSSSAIATAYGVSEGDYYVLVVADGTSRVQEVFGEGDNVAVGPRIHVSVPTPPDLIIASVRAPEQAFSGQPMTLPYTVRNAGAALNGSEHWLDVVYMSADTVLNTTQDIRLTSVSNSASTLRGGDEYSSSPVVLLPVGVSGTFYFFVLTDANNAVDEFAFELNNSGFDEQPTIVHLTPPPDLEIQSLDLPAAVDAGRPFTLRYRVNNSGATRTPNTAWTDSFYLSADQILDSGDTLLDELRISLPRFQNEPGGLDVDDSYTREITLHTPFGLSGGYFLFAVADSGNHVFELDDENNRTVPLPLALSSRPPDLVAGIDTSDPAAAAGAALRVQWSVRNQGVGDTIVGSWTDQLFASVDLIAGNEDDRLLGTREHSGVLLPGATYTGSAVATIPTEFEGGYYLYVTIDTTHVVYEAAEGNNNSQFRPFVVARSTADLEITPLALAPEEGRLRLEWRVRNASDTATNANSWTDVAFLSVNDVFGDDDDRPIGSFFHSGALGPQQQYVNAKVINVPFEFSGRYNLFVRSDRDNQVDEGGREANNVAFAGFVQASELRHNPDLVVAQVTAPTEAISGQYFSVGWTVRNRGDAIPASGPLPPEFRSGRWTDSVFLSRDQIFDPGSDLFLGQFDASPSELSDETATGGALQQYSRLQTFLMPAGRTGPFYVFVVTDRGDAIVENALGGPGESNNATRAPVAMFASLAPPVDLVLGNITVPENSVPGAAFSASYTLHNAGNNTAAGYWADRLYLSADDQFSLDDISLALHEHPQFAPPIAPGDDLHQEVRGQLAGVLPGDYFLILRADAFNNLPESNEANNLAASLETFHIDVPEILMANGEGTAEIETDVFNQGTRSFFFRFDAEPGQTLEIHAEWAPVPPLVYVVHENGLDLEVSHDRPRQTVTAAYVTRGAMPTRFDREFAQEELLQSFAHSSTNDSLIIPRTEQGTYFIRIDVHDTHPREFREEIPIGILNGSLEHFFLRVSRLPFTLITAEPSRIGNTGSVTLDLTASNFDPCSTVQLVNSGIAVRGAQRVMLAGATQALATFDTTGLASGSYEVRVFDHSGSSSTQPIELVQGIGPQVSATVDGPELVRLGRDYVFYVNYGNRGDADAVAPLLLVDNLAGNAFALSRDGLAQPIPAGQAVQVLGISQSGPAGVLRPGELGSVPFFFRTDPVPGHYRVRTITADDNRPLSFVDIEAQMRPQGIDDASWNQIRARLLALIGGTWGTYVRALADAATHLSSLGLRTPDVSALFAELLREASMPQTVSLSGQAVAENDCRTVSDLRVRAVASDGKPFIAATDETGGYRLHELPAGTYTLIADANGRARTRLDGVILGETQQSLTIRMANESIVHGVVDLGSGGPTDGTLVVSALRQSEPDDSVGFFEAHTDELGFTLGRLAAGAYGLTFRREGYVPLTTNITVGAGENVDLGVLSLTATARLAGTLTSHLDGSPVDERSIGIFDGRLLVAAVRADSSGHFVAEDLPPGQYTVRVSDGLPGFGNEITVALGPGQNLSDINLTLLPGASLQGAVTETTTGQPLAGVRVFAFGPDGVTRSAFTDDSGTYRIDGVGLGMHVLTLGAAGTGSAGFADVTQIDGNIYRADLSLARAATLTGRVVLFGGTPVSDALVRLTEGGRAIAVARTAEDGRYSFLLTRVGTFELQASSDGASFSAAHGVSVSQGQARELDLVSGQAVLIVRPVDSAASITGAGVLLFQSVDTQRLLIGSTVIGSSGEARFSNLANGDYEVHVVGSNRRGAALAIVLTPGETRIASPILEDRFVVNGRVTTDAGAPLAGASVSLVSAADPQRQIPATTDLDGTYTYPSIAPGAYELVVRADGFETTIHPSITVTADAVVDVALLPSTSQVSGRLVDGTGQPVPHGLVSVQDVQGRVLGEASVEHDGTFLIRGAVGQRLIVRAFSVGFVENRTGEVSLTAGGTIALGDIGLRDIAVTKGAERAAGGPSSSAATPLEAAALGSGSVEPNFSDGSFTIDASPFPGWLQTLTQDIPRDPGHIFPNHIPALPSGCLEVGAALHAAIDAQRAQDNAYDYMHDLDNEIDSRALTAAAKAAQSASFIIVTVASVVVAANALAAAAGAATLLGGPLVATFGIAQTVQAVLQIADSLPQIAQEPSVDDAYGHLAQDSNFLSSAIQVFTEAQGRLLTAFGTVSETFLLRTLGVLGAIGNILGAVGSAADTMNTLNTVFFHDYLTEVDVMRQLKHRRDNAQATYIEKVHAARQALDAYLAELRSQSGDSQGDGVCRANDALDDRNNPPLPPLPPPVPTPPPPPDPGDDYHPRPVVSSDPNDITGPAGFGDEHWVPAADNLAYLIRFENKSDASGPAQRVTITQQLDSDLDFRTFRVDDFGWGGTRIQLDGRSSFFYGRVDLGDAVAFDVDVTVSIDTATGLAQWVLQTVDPSTGEAPTDALAGFLPPNDQSQLGEGFVSYTVRPKRAVQTGARIDAAATIVFDSNEPIDTPQIFHTLDAEVPTSSVRPPPDGLQEPVFVVRWSAADNPDGSALAGLDVFVSEDGGPYVQWLANTSLAEAPFAGAYGKSYAFYTVARDNAGNIEAAPTVPDSEVFVRPIVAGEIRGQKFNDLDGDGSKDPDEPGLAGWTIFLDSNGDGLLDPGEVSTVTDATGNYAFTGLAPGSYIVAEVMQEGWMQTSPGPGGSTSGAVVSRTPLDSNVRMSIAGVRSSEGATASNPASAERAAELIDLSAFRNDPRFAGIDGHGFSVVVLDTGIDADHPFFGADIDSDGAADSIIYQWDFVHGDAVAGDDNGHGSHVSSIIGSRDLSHPGVAPGVNLIVLKVLDGTGSGSFASVERALRWVVDHAAQYHIASVNMSFGDGGNYRVPQLRAGMSDELAELAAIGVIVVSASGNDFFGAGSSQGVAYPSADPNSLSVGAVWSSNLGGPFVWRNGARDYSSGEDHIASFSQRDEALTDVFASGVFVQAAGLGGIIATYSGTSMAAPYVTAVAALAQQLAVQALGRQLTVAEFRTLLHGTGDPINDGDDERDNVNNTNLDFARLDVLGLANQILALAHGGPTAEIGGGLGGTAVPSTAVRRSALIAGSRPVQVVAGEVQNGVDFGNFRLGSIQGRAFDDRDHDGLMTANERGLADWTVFLDSDGDAAMDDDEARAVTGPDGTFAFNGLGPVSIRVLVAPRLGWSRTSADASVFIRSGLTLEGHDIGVADVTAPQISGVPSDQILEATSAGGAVAQFALPQATDLADPNPSVACVLTSGSVFPIGTSTVSCSATDQSGNRSSVSFAITVRDTVAPDLSELPPDRIVEATGPSGAAVSFVLPGVHDAVDVDPLVTCSHASGSLFPLGTTAVTCSVVDDSGNRREGSFSVTVRDTTAPDWLSLPADRPVEATGPSGAAVLFALPGVHDAVDVDPLVTCSHASGSLFPLGTTVVTCTATDDAANRASSTFAVVVHDSIPPAIVGMPQNRVVEATSVAGATVTFTLPTAADAVDSNPVVFCTPASGATFSIGTNSIECRAIDDAGNSSVSSFTVMVTDSTGPQVSRVELVGTKSVTDIIVHFNESLGAINAERIANYRIATAPGRDRRFGTSDDKTASIGSLHYNPATQTVLIHPTRALPFNNLFHLTIVGANGVSDLHDNQLDGNADGMAGDDYQTLIGRMTRFEWTDADKDRGTLSVSKGAYFDVRLTDEALIPEVQLVGSSSHAKLTGRVNRSKRGDGQVPLRLTGNSSGVDMSRFRQCSPTNSSRCFQMAEISAALVDRLLESGTVSRSFTLEP
jgi:subtilase family serine protease